MTFTVELSHGKHPKLVVELTKKLEKLKVTQDIEERYNIADSILKNMSLKLVTFGPILRVLYAEYSEYVKISKRKSMIEEKRRLL